MKKTKYLLAALLLLNTPLTCMWDQPALSPSFCKNFTQIPKRLPDGTPRKITTNYIEGANIYSQSIGQGKPIIVLHGGPGLSSDYLMPHMERLARDHQLIVFDQRGCGKSEGCEDPDNICIERYVKDIEAVRQAHANGKAVILGHSWGGFLAMHYAMAYPQNVDKLILVDSMPATSEGLSSFAEEYAKRLGPYQEKIAMIQASSEFLANDTDVTEEYYKTIFKTYMRDSDDVNRLNLKMTPEAIFNGTRVSVLMNDKIFAFPYDIRNQLRFLDIPTLIIHGDVDPIPATTANEIHKYIEGSNFVVIRDSGHFPFVEKPELFFEAVNNFIQ